MDYTRVLTKAQNGFYLGECISGVDFLRLMLNSPHKYMCIHVYISVYIYIYRIGLTDCQWCFSTFVRVGMYYVCMYACMHASLQCHVMYL